MITLVRPNKQYLKSYTEAFDEYTAAGVSTYGMSDPRAMDIFEKHENYRLGRNLKPDRVPSDCYWLVDTEKEYFLGEIHIRRRLNEALALRGGHIGYVIRCSEWNKGYGTRMLSLALEKAKAMGLEKVLITCNDTNLASARVMEKNGCILQDKVEVPDESGTMLVRRYWKTL